MQHFRWVFTLGILLMLWAGGASFAQTTGEPEPSLPLSNEYKAIWAKKSVQVLQQNGIQLPDGIDYNQIIAKKEFNYILSKVTTIDRKTFQSMVDSQSSDTISRGAAIDSLIRAFGMSQSLETFQREESRFKDISPQHAAYGAIVMAEKTHLINGYPDRTIRPNEPLSWGEALILTETVYTWRKAIPTTDFSWVGKYRKQQNVWHQLIDGFRLLLTLVYAGLAIVFLIRAFLRSRKTREHPLQPISVLLVFTTLAFLVMWINELLYAYGIMHREIYQIFALVSIFASLMLLKTGTFMDEKIAEPKPQAVIDVGYVDSINLDRGELFVIDAVSKKRALALVTPETRIYNQENNLLSRAFLSEVKVGDFVNVNGTSRLAGTLIDIEKLLLIASQSTELKATREIQLQQLQQTEPQTRYNKVIRKQIPEAKS